MKNDKTLICMLLDRSGSMESCRSDVIGGFNLFVEEQKKPHVGQKFLSLVQFDDKYEPIYNMVPINEVKDLTYETFVPRGSTALLDAMKQFIDTVGVQLKNTPEEDRPEKVIFVIYTDGEENSSRQASYKDVETRITHQKDVYKWQFVFLGANQDAIATASKMGIGANSSLTYNTARSANAFNSASKIVTSYVQTSFDNDEVLKSVSFDKKDRTDAV